MGLCASCAREPPEFVPFRETGGQIKILIIALDYKYNPQYELTCIHDAKSIFNMAQRAGVGDITFVHDRDVGGPTFPTRSTVLREMRKVAGRCAPGDWFVFFWAGHGVNVADTNGDEGCGFDQAFVTPDITGYMDEQTVLLDDDFAKALDTFVPQGVRILAICDCCHSGTICDIDSFQYHHEIYQISAAQDDQEAADTGKGGVLSTSLRRSVRELSMLHGSSEFSIADVYEKSQTHARKMSKIQDLNMQFQGADPAFTAWPLCFPWYENVNPVFDKLDNYEIRS